MRNYVIIGTGGDTVLHRAVFRDVADGAVPGAHYLPSGKFFQSRSPLLHALTSQKLKRLMERSSLARLLFGRAAAAARKRRHADMRRLRSLLSRDRENCVVLAPGTAMRWVTPALVQALRSEPLCHHLVFYFIDSLASSANGGGRTEAELLALLRMFDAAYTYDRVDAARCPDVLRHLDIPVWRAEASAPPHIQYDLYFCGSDKKRAPALREIYDRVTGAGLRLRYLLVGSPERSAARDGIVYSAWMPYEETVRGLLDANCILEFIAERNNEATLRYKEAVMYNKKLLTNNPNVASLPYYDGRWMRCFRTAADIDLEWLRAVEPVDYGYRGDFSAQVFLERIEAQM